MRSLWVITLWGILLQAPVVCLIGMKRTFDSIQTFKANNFMEEKEKSTPHKTFIMSTGGVTIEQKPKDDPCEKEVAILP